MLTTLLSELALSLADKSLAPVQLTLLTPSIGCEVQGLDLREPLDTGQVAALHSLFLDRSVLVFRNQSLDREQHKAFARYFGALHTHPSRLGRRGDPHIFKVRADATSTLNNGGLWHSDLSCEVNPPLGSALLLHELPEGGGGDTLFINMCDVYAGLSQPLREFLQGLTAWHDGRKDLRNYGITLEPGKTYPQTHHPVVVHHSQTGRPLLFVNRAFTESINELAPAESSALLNLLYSKIADGVRSQCRVRWEPGTLVLWDNRNTQHNAVWDYFPNSRYGERVSIVDPLPTGNAGDLFNSVDSGDSGEQGR